VHPWTLDPATGAPLVPITTFSIAMAHRQSGGRLPLFVDGLRSLVAQSGGRPLAASDRVLIAEACNHNRITSDCNDIGMVQLPRKLEAMCGGKGPAIEHAFGRCAPAERGTSAGAGSLRQAALERQFAALPILWRLKHHGPRFAPAPPPPYPPPPKGVSRPGGRLAGQVPPRAALRRLHDRRPEDAGAAVGHAGAPPGGSRGWVGAAGGAGAAAAWSTPRRCGRGCRTCRWPPGGGGSRGCGCTGATCTS
jgi:hypothetical protein